MSPKPVGVAAHGQITRLMPGDVREGRVGAEDGVEEPHRENEQDRAAREEARDGPTSNARRTRRVCPTSRASPLRLRSSNAGPRAAAEHIRTFRRHAWILGRPAGPRLSARMGAALPCPREHPRGFWAARGGATRRRLQRRGLHRRPRRPRAPRRRPRAAASPAHGLEVVLVAPAGSRAPDGCGLVPLDDVGGLVERGATMVVSGFLLERHPVLGRRAAPGRRRGRAVPAREPRRPPDGGARASPARARGRVGRARAAARRGRPRALRARAPARPDARDDARERRARCPS